VSYPVTSWQQLEQGEQWAQRTAATKGVNGNASQPNASGSQTPTSPHRPRALTGAEILWATLVGEGVDTVFGYPGGAILPVYDALRKFPIHHVLVRHEQGAAHMADGYARASGKVGVAIATSGPGATNLVTGIATAMLDSIPIVCITGNVSSKCWAPTRFRKSTSPASRCRSPSTTSS
jgi:hypothetical protein